MIVNNDWTAWDVTSLVSVTLQAGNNSIQLVAEASVGLANIDWIQVTGLSPSPGS